jgi:hypothetical protein
VLELYRLVPIINITKQFNLFGGRKKDIDATSIEGNSIMTLAMDERETSPQSLEIQKSVDGISLVALADVDKNINNGQEEHSNNSK